MGSFVKKLGSDLGEFDFIIIIIRTRLVENVSYGVIGCVLPWTMNGDFEYIQNAETFAA